MTGMLRFTSIASANCIVGARRLEGECRTWCSMNGNFQMAKHPVEAALESRD